MKEFVVLQQAHTCLVQTLHTQDQRLGMSPDEPYRAQASQSPNEEVENKLLKDLAEKDEKLQTLRQDHHELEMKLAQRGYLCNAGQSSVLSSQSSALSTGMTGGPAGIPRSRGRISLGAE